MDVDSDEDELDWGTGTLPRQISTIGLLEKIYDFLEPYGVFARFYHLWRSRMDEIDGYGNFAVNFDQPWAFVLPNEHAISQLVKMDIFLKTPSQNHVLNPSKQKHERALYEEMIGSVEVQDGTPISIQLGDRKVPVTFKNDVAYIGAVRVTAWHKPTQTGFPHLFFINGLQVSKELRQKLEKK